MDGTAINLTYFDVIDRMPITPNIKIKSVTCIVDNQVIYHQISNRGPTCSALKFENMLFFKRDRAQRQRQGHKTERKSKKENPSHTNLLVLMNCLLCH